ncbi:MAG: 3-alpha,7-alpha,12-alpha-trihydroxy-5-beta-cholest-24-enoyl-CoA hydratase, partial [Candidatus Binatia bacterium]
MPIDLAQAKNAQPQKAESSWDEDKVILYHLGLGAGLGKPTDPKELEYTYEGNLKVLPSFGVVPVFGALGSLAGIPGVEINFALVLHGEQDIEIHRPIPTSA